MTPKAVLFGSIGTLVETSDIQRQAFNAAFEEAGLDWSWSEDEYARLLERPGGLSRIEDYNRARGAKIDAAAIHARKSELFREALADGVDLRPGVAETIAAAHRSGVPVGICSTTDRSTVELILTKARPGLPSGAIVFRGSRDEVANDKPAPDIWHVALRALSVAAGEAVAIEDSPENAAGAVQAGLRVVAFPGRSHTHRPFPAASAMVTELSPGALGLANTPPLAAE